MANDTEKLWAITDEIRKDTNKTMLAAKEIEGSVNTITELFKAHVDNKCIHHNEPCEYLKNVNFKIIGALVAALAAIGGTVLSVAAQWIT